MSFSTKFKLAIAIIILAIFGTFLFLNREEVDVNLIVGSIKMSRAVMVLAVFGSGFLLGRIFRSVFRVKLPKGD